MNFAEYVQVFVVPIAVAFAFMLPAVIVALVLLRRKKIYQAAADEPFTSLPLRPPGESLRLKIEELSDKFDEELMSICLAGMIATSMVMATPPSLRGTIAPALFVFSVSVSVWRGQKLFAIARRLWDYRLGFMGERVVGEELNQLLVYGYRVFHDVPFDGFNVDHVIVGPPGVYVIETKARRKPAHIGGKERARIVFDGDTLHFATGIDCKAIEQVRLSAKTIAEWLTNATGEQTTAKGILTFPGWFVEKNAFDDVRVVNPEQIKFLFADHPRQTLNAPQLQRIAHQLTERCRLPRPKK